MRRKYPPLPRKGAQSALARLESEMKKEEISIRLIRGLWDSLESHLDYCVEPSLEGKPFHRQCVQEYADMIQLASKRL